jgi:hypothetical protein
MNLSNEVLPSPGEGGWGRTQPTGNGVEEVDHGKVGVAGKRDGANRPRRNAVRRSVRWGPGWEVGLLGSGSPLETTFGIRGSCGPDSESSPGPINHAPTASAITIAHAPTSQFIPHAPKYGLIHW